MKEIGLALGGGAVLGAAHIGVIRAIEQSDVKVTHIAGTSIGAFVAAFFAFGKSWEEMRDIASDLKWMDITEISLSKYGLLSNDKLGELIEEHLGEKNIEDADIPLAFVATDAANGEKVILDKGPIARAVMASTSIPGIFQPVEIDDKILVDGGVAENVPVKTVVDMGCGYSVGVDLNSKHAFEKPGNILEVILNSFHFLMQQADKLSTEEADLLILPDLSEFNRSDTSQIEELIQKGYEDSKNVLDKKDW